MPEISIIIPVFNVENYLSRCLDSIIDQEYSNFEVILIDDGSNDNSGFICDEYVKRDCRFVVLHKKNEGVSTARNLGIEKSKGKYICFIDSDDYIDSQFLKHFAEIFKVKKPDLCVCGFSKIIEDSRRSEFIIPDTSKIGFIERLEDMARKSLLNSVWAKLFRRDIIIKNQINFQMDIRFGEDTMFSWEYLFFVESIEVVGYADYNYVQYDSVTLTSKVYEYEIQKKIADLIYQRKRKIIETVKAYDTNLHSYIDSEYFFLIIRAYTSLYNNNFNYQKPYRIKKWKEFPMNVNIEYFPISSIFLKFLKYLIILKQYHTLDLLMKLRQKKLKLK